MSTNDYYTLVLKTITYLLGFRVDRCWTRILECFSWSFDHRREELRGVDLQAKSLDFENSLRHSTGNINFYKLHDRFAPALTKIFFSASSILEKRFRTRYRNSSRTISAQRSWAMTDKELDTFTFLCSWTMIWGCTDIA